MADEVTTPAESVVASNDSVQAASESTEAEQAEVVAEQAVELSDDDKKGMLLEYMTKCMAEHGGESNIPIYHEYWDKLREYRYLLNKGK